MAFSIKVAALLVGVLLPGVLAQDVLPGAAAAALPTPLATDVGIPSGPAAGPILPQVVPAAAAAAATPPATITPQSLIADDGWIGTTNALTTRSFGAQGGQTQYSASCPAGKTAVSCAGYASKFQVVAHSSFSGIVPRGSQCICNFYNAGAATTAGVVCLVFCMT